jgi:signal transduction histidine kinase
VRPPQLDEGLAPALRELAGRAGLPVEVEVTAQRFSPGIEAAAYFVACEGLTNATRHASANRVSLRSVREADRLVLTISDDGVGGASADGGTGITGLADRVHAHGGTLSVHSPLDQGTVLTAEFPCGS